MNDIRKSFGGLEALRGVDFDVHAGEVHALIGENGAGKSTLMNVLAGRFHDYDGDIRFLDKPIRLRHPRQALEMGIEVIYQDLSVLPNLTVAENIMLGEEPRGRIPGTLDRSALRREAKNALDYLHFDLPVEERVENLSAARQCLVEIARAVRKKARLLVFDEPTASLGSEDIEKLFQVIRDLKSRGLGIVYISHRLAELPEIADRVTVLRDGKPAGTRTMDEVNLSDLSRMMLGRDLAEVFPKRKRRIGESVLRVMGLTDPGYFEDISFELHAGEVLGLAGLVGSGRTEIARAIFGAGRATGRVEFRGKAIPRRSPSRCKRYGAVMVPENRKRDGNITGRSVMENANIGILHRLTRAAGYLSPRISRDRAEQTIDRMRVEPPYPWMEIQQLSGGNQQKTIVGRALASDPQVIVFDEPTQGIDVGTKAQVYQLVARLADEGRAVLLISSESIEIVELADRALVLCEGRIVEEISCEETSEEQLFQACLGKPKES